MHAQRREEYQCQWPMHAIAAAAGGPGISDLFIPAAAAAAAALLFLLCFFFFFLVPSLWLTFSERGNSSSQRAMYRECGSDARGTELRRI